MNDLVEAWKEAWKGYGISDYSVIIALVIAAVCFYRNWQKTALILWLLIYSWSMTVLLSGQYIDINAGMIALWVCTYGLFGFLLLGVFIYYNLKG